MTSLRSAPVPARLKTAWRTSWRSLFELDDSATGRVQDGGKEALVSLPNGDIRENRRYLGFSFDSELFALRATLERLSSIYDQDTSHTVVFCTDSMAALAPLEIGFVILVAPVTEDFRGLLRPLTDR